MKKAYHLILYLALSFCLISCHQKDNETRQEAPQWSTIEIKLLADSSYLNPYTDVDLWAVFTSESGQEMKRPAFWDGGQNWTIRFASPDSNSIWRWETFCSARGGALGFSD